MISLKIDAMKTMKLNMLAAAMVVGLAGLAQAQDAGVVNSFNSSVLNSAIPDGNPNGTTFTTAFSGIQGTITNVTVSLDITGGFNGDLYAFLAGPNGGFSVLLNRVGLTTGNSTGYSDPGFNISITDESANNIHYYQTEGGTSGVQLTGTWAPDGRYIDPQSSPGVFAATSPTADLSSFNNHSINGTWTLFIADLSGGGQATLVSWGLTVVTVPEPQTWMLMAGGIGSLLLLRRYRKP